MRPIAINLAQRSPAKQKSLQLGTCNSCCCLRCCWCCCCHQWKVANERETNKKWAQQMKINQIKFTTCPERRCDRRDDSSIKCITSECIFPSQADFPLPSSHSLASSSPNKFVATCDKQMQFAVELHWLYLIIIFDFFVASPLCLACLFSGTRERYRERQRGEGKVCTIFVYGGQCTFWLIHQQFRAVEGQAREHKRKCWKSWPGGSSCIKSRYR